MNESKRAVQMDNLKEWADNAMRELIDAQNLSNRLDEVTFKVVEHQRGYSIHPNKNLIPPKLQTKALVDEVAKFLTMAIKTEGSNIRGLIIQKAEALNLKYEEEEEPDAGEEPDAKNGAVLSDDRDSGGESGGVDGDLGTD